MIDRFDTGDAFYEPGFVPVNMLDQFGLCIRRACDEDRLGVRQRRSTRGENRPDPRPRYPILCSSPCMAMGCWIGGMRDRLVRAVPVKIKKNACFAMIDLHDGVGMAGHPVSLQLFGASPSSEPGPAKLSAVR